MLRHSNLMRNNRVKQRKEKLLPRKSFLAPSDLKRLELPGLDLSESFHSFCPQHSSLSWVIFRLRSFRRGHLSDSYSWTTSQPSLLRSAIFINFCLLRMICCASCTKLNTWLESSVLVFIRERGLFSSTFTSNCFLLPLNLNSEADLSIFNWSSIRFPFQLVSSWVLRHPLNQEETSSTNSEL